MRFCGLWMMVALAGGLLAACGDDDSFGPNRNDNDDPWENLSSPFSSSDAQVKSSSSSSKTTSSSLAQDAKFNAFTDERDGHVYRVVQVGDLVWMADNLNYYDVSKVSYLMNSSWCIDGKGSNCGKSGRLYTYAAATGDSTCPKGWRLPLDYEWKTIKSEWESVKDSFNLVATGEYFSTLKTDDYARYWSATEANSSAAVEWYILTTSASAVWGSQEYDKKMGYAVRCVADADDVRLDTYVEYEKISSSSEKRSSSSSVVSSSSMLSSSSAMFSSSSEEFSSSSEKVSSSSVEASSSSISKIVPVAEYDEFMATWKSGLLTKAGDCDDCNAFTDARDGNVYRVVVIGEQVWMAENLRFAETEDGYSTCPFVEKDSASGCLYDFDAANSACPAGWKLPSTEDWATLLATSQKMETSVCVLISKDAQEMGRVCSTRDESGFSAYPTGEFSEYHLARSDDVARYWTSTEANSLGATEWYFQGAGLQKQNYEKRYGYGVRCILSEKQVLDAVRK